LLPLHWFGVLALPFVALALMFVGFPLLFVSPPHVCCHLSSLWGGVNVALFIISTSIAPYEQWLTGGVVALCDMASQHCCPTLQPHEQRVTAAV
jgi:hypothetical protein